MKLLLILLAILALAVSLAAVAFHRERRQWLPNVEPDPADWGGW